jgi:hypothetical protein
MSKLMHSLIAAALGAGLVATAQADNMSRDQYKAEKDRIEAQYKRAKARCDSLSGNAKDLCTVEAKGAEKVAEAELEARREGTAKARQDARLARIEAE